MVQRIDAARGDDAGLTHAAAEELARAACLGDHRLGADERGADRSAETF